MKKYLFIFVLMLMPVLFIYSQNVERLTFTELRPDGTLIGNVTVNAVFIGWSQQNVSLEGNLLVIYERYYQKGSSDWSDWKLSSKQPSLIPSLRALYDTTLNIYINQPRGAIRANLNNVQVVRIMTIPNGNSSPCWWSNDGRSYNVMYENWAIKP